MVLGHFAQTLVGHYDFKVPTRCTTLLKLIAMLQDAIEVNGNGGCKTVSLESLKPPSWRINKRHSSYVSVQHKRPSTFRCRILTRKPGARYHQIRKGDFVTANRSKVRFVRAMQTAIPASSPGDPEDEFAYQSENLDMEDVNKRYTASGSGGRVHSGTSIAFKKKASLA